MKALLIAIALLTMAAPVSAGPETVKIRTEDGLSLEADYFAAESKGSAAVIALHMYDSDRSPYRSLTRWFRERGMAFLTVDMRGHGGSRLQGGEDLGKRVDKRDPALFNAMHGDALAAWRFLESRGLDPDRVAFLGANVGCGVAVDAIGREERLRGACLLTPGENDLGIPTMEHLKRWGAQPLVVLTSEEECDKGPRAVAAAVPHARLRILEGHRGIHGTKMLGRVKGVESEISGWFGRALGAPVAMDGKLSRAEAVATGGTRTFRLAGFEVRIQSRGSWLHVVLTPRDGTKLPDRFLLTAAPMAGDVSRARAVATSWSGDGLRGQSLRPRDEEWMPVRRRPISGAPRLRLARGTVLEMLIPRDRGAWIPQDAHLRVGFAVGTGRDGPWTPLTGIGPKSTDGWLAWPGK